MLRIEEFEGRPSTSVGGSRSLGGAGVYALRHRRRVDYFARKADAIQAGNMLALELAADGRDKDPIVIEQCIVRDLPARELIVALLEGEDWCEAKQPVATITVPTRTVAEKAVAPRKRKG